VALATALLNLVLELVLVYGFDQGIGASALATVIAQTVGAVVYVSGVVRAVRRLGVGVRPELRVVARLLRLGGALLVRTAALRGALAVATAVATRIGTDDVAAHEIAFAVWSLLALGLDAVAIAGQAMIGRALGAGRADDARAAAGRMIELGFAAGVVLAVIVLAARPILPPVFSGDPAVRDLAAFLLVWVAVLQPVNGVVFVLDGVLIGAGDMRFLAVAMVGAFAVFAAAAGAVGALDLGIGWLWAAIGLLMLARVVPLWWRFTTGRWIVLGAGR
jgi:putative MATE family efflux protein